MSVGGLWGLCAFAFVLLAANAEFVRLLRPAGRRARNVGIAHSTKAQPFDAAGAKTLADMRRVATSMAASIGVVEREMQSLGLAQKGDPKICPIKMTSPHAIYIIMLYAVLCLGVVILQLRVSKELASFVGIRGIRPIRYQ